METLYIINKVTVHNMYSNFINNVSITILYMYYICMYVCVKETILRKSEYQQKELKFKKTSLSINVQNMPFSLEFLDTVTLVII